MTTVLPSTGTATVAPGPVTPAGWWPLVSVDDVENAGRIPLPVSIEGSPWVVVVLDGEVAALRDLCPHRRVPLSAGSVADQPTGQVLECGYHGWSYDKNGHCASIPALGEGRVPRGMGSVAALHAVASNGVVWGTVDAESAGPVPEISPDRVFLCPQKVLHPAAKVIAALSGDSVGAATLAGTEFVVPDSDLSYFVRPITSDTTSVFPLVRATSFEIGVPAWLSRIEQLNASAISI